IVANVDERTARSFYEEFPLRVNYHVQKHKDVFGDTVKVQISHCGHWHTTDENFAEHCDAANIKKQDLIMITPTQWNTLQNAKPRELPKTWFDKIFGI